MNTAFVGVSGTVLAFEKSSGAQLWSTYLDGGFGDSFASLATDGTYVFAHTRGKLFCLEAATGQILWMNELAGMGYGTASLCALAGSPDAEPAILKAHQKKSVGS